MFKETLIEIDGIGPATAEKIVGDRETVDEIVDALDNDVIKVTGLTDELKQKAKEALLDTVTPQKGTKQLNTKDFANRIREFVKSGKSKGYILSTDMPGMVVLSYLTPATQIMTIRDRQITFNSQIHKVYLSRLDFFQDYKKFF